MTYPKLSSVFIVQTFSHGDIVWRVLPLNLALGGIMFEGAPLKIIVSLNIRKYCNVMQLGTEKSKLVCIVFDIKNKRLFFYPKFQSAVLGG